MPVDRLMPTEEADELIALVREDRWGLASSRRALRPRRRRRPVPARCLLTSWGETGLLLLPFDQAEASGGLGQPYEVYLQVLEEILATELWMTVGGRPVGTHACRTTALARFVLFRCNGERGSRICSAARSARGLRRCPNRRRARTSWVSQRVTTGRSDDGDQWRRRGPRRGSGHGSARRLLAVVRPVPRLTPRRLLFCPLLPCARRASNGMSFGAPEKKDGDDSNPPSSQIVDGARGCRPTC